jgi:GDP-L-fucose synthase
LLSAPLEYTNEPYAIAKIAGIKLCESYNLQYGTNFISVMPTNLYGPNDNFDLEKSHVLPALIRKIHLGKCLEAYNWDAIRADLNHLPIEGVDGSASQDAIISILTKYNVTLSGVEVWGSGKPMREFLWSEEMADASIFIMENINFSDVVRGTTLQGGETTTTQSHSPSALYSGEIRNTHINIGTGKEISIKELAELIKAHIGFKGELIFNTSKPDGTLRKLTDVKKLHQLGWKHKVEIEEGVQLIYDWYINQ